MIRREYDEGTGIIQVRGSGSWTFSDIERHYAALGEMVAGIRASGGLVRVLSDVTGADRQAAWVEDYILDQMSRTFHAGDRIAFLAAHEADQLYLQSLPASVELASFTSRTAAEQWLSAAATGPDKG